MSAAERPAISVGKAKYGRGVYATRVIKAGELFDEAPVVVVPMCDEFILLADYVYGWIPETEKVAVAMGNGSFYNHSYTPNAVYHKRHADCAIDYIALRDIAVGEEIKVNYNGDPTCTAPLWFPVDTEVLH